MSLTVFLLASLLATAAEPAAPEVMFVEPSNLQAVFGEVAVTAVVYGEVDVQGAERSTQDSMEP